MLTNPIARHEIRGPTASARGVRHHHPPVAVMHPQAYRARLRTPTGSPVPRSLHHPNGGTAKRSAVADRISRHKLHGPATATDGDPHLHPKAAGAAADGGHRRGPRPHGPSMGRFHNPTTGKREINGRLKTKRFRRHLCPPSDRRQHQAHQMARRCHSAGARLKHRRSTHRAALPVRARDGIRCRSRPHHRMLSCFMICTMQAPLRMHHVSHRRLECNRECRTCPLRCRTAHRSRRSFSAFMKSRPQTHARSRTSLRLRLCRKSWQTRHATAHATIMSFSPL